MTDLDIPETKYLKTEYPVAAKEHKCVICRRLILKGEKHTKLTFIEDSKFISMRSHLDKMQCQTNLYPHQI